MGRPGHDTTPRQVRAPLGSVTKRPQQLGRRPAWPGSTAFHGQLAQGQLDPRWSGYCSPVATTKPVGFIAVPRTRGIGPPQPARPAGGGGADAMTERTRAEDGAQGRGDRGGQAPQRPTQLPGGSWWAAVKRTVREFQVDNLSDWAAALTYYSVLSIFPALLVMVSL